MQTTNSTSAYMDITLELHHIRQKFVVDSSLGRGDDEQYRVAVLHTLIV